MAEFPVWVDLPWSVSPEEGRRLHAAMDDLVPAGGMVDPSREPGTELSFTVTGATRDEAVALAEALVAAVMDRARPRSVERVVHVSLVPNSR